MPYGVSNSFKRGTIKTYSSQQNRRLSYIDVDIPRRHIRMDDTGNAIERIIPARSIEPASSSTAPSSPPPSDRAILSSDATRDGTISPPSSPPRRPSSPTEELCTSSLSSLKRKRDATIDVLHSEPLSDITNKNTRKARLPRPAKKARLTQMQIDLGGEIRKACKGCGMDYIPSNAEDAALHKEFHVMNLGGVVLGKAFVSDVIGSGRKTLDVSSVRREAGLVVVVDRRGSLAVRNKAKKVLDIVNRELSAAEIEDEMLWRPGNITAVKKSGTRKKRTAAPETADDREDRFKVFLYLLGDKCIGLCLAERISNAFKVVSPDQGPPPEKAALSPARSSSISTSPTRDPALLGISRIWTSKSHRRKGIAALLLDCARTNFFYGIEVPKEMVAFSQPTESGGRLAERWFAQAEGWHVYSEAG